MNRTICFLAVYWLAAACADNTAANGDLETSPDKATDSSSNATDGGDTNTDVDTHDPHPIEDTPVTQGGTITFTNIGASGWWPRRLDLPNGNSACNYKDGTDTWGGVCCMEKHYTSSEALAPFDEEMILLLKALSVKQLAVYQPESEGQAAPWNLVSFFDSRLGSAQNFAFTKGDTDNAFFDGALTGDDCLWYVMQDKLFDCERFEEYYCPNDPGINHRGWSGSKLITFLGNMDFDDSAVQSCGGAGLGHPGPWVAFVSAELIRDGARKWNGLCNCYSRTGSVGDGCGEINVFEVVMDGNEYSNREFISTGIRSFQNGHVGGSVCGAGCDRRDYPYGAEVVDACSQQGYTKGPTVVSGGSSDGCPVWKRPVGDRFFLILLDAATRSIQVAIVHPRNIPQKLGELFPTLPTRIQRTTIDNLAQLRLP